MSDFDGLSMGEEVTAFEQRLARFQEIAQSTEGPLGTLFKQVALSQQQYADAAERHGTTVGECARLVCALEAAMAAADWLQSNRSDALVEIPLGQWIREIADQTTSEHVLPEAGESPWDS